jgi:hypothetical protein
MISGIQYKPFEAMEKGPLPRTGANPGVQSNQQRAPAQQQRPDLAQFNIVLKHRV